MRIHPRIMVLLLVLGFGSGSLAAPIAITSETAVSINFGYQYQPSGIASIGVAFETPFQLVSIVDTSIVARAGYSFAGGFDAGATLKAVVFPSLYGGLIAAGIWVDASGYNIGTAANLFKVGFGPMLNFDLEPLHITLSVSLLTLTNATLSFDLGVAARYYLDAFALEASWDYNTVGFGRANFGLRFTL